ncbi:hypothetical protein HZA43_00575, partial [Candidatus Peregrinibacteria bacterium]|nr:hypothetical protein [Candidatus Peregrinibacteria bacterium]
MSFTLDGVKLNARSRNWFGAILFKIGELILSTLFIVSLAGPMIFSENANAAAGVANYLSYQGRLTDQNGNPKTGTFCFKFSIYDSGGTQRWPAAAPTGSSTVVSNGVFNNDIGSADVWGTFNFYDYSDAYLDIQVATTCGGSFESLTPRQRLNSVPFAKVAQDLYGGSVRIGDPGGVLSGNQKYLHLAPVTNDETVGG